MHASRRPLLLDFFVLLAIGVLVFMFLTAVNDGRVEDYIRNLTAGS